MAEIKVAMLGPRGVGKTSLLVAIWQEMNHINQQLPLSVSVRGDISILDQHLQEMKKLPDEFVATRQQGGTVRQFDFKFIVTAPNKHELLSMTFTDYPGGWVVDPQPAGGDQSSIAAILRESDVVLLAVDTPPMVSHLQLHGGVAIGRYCEDFNAQAAISKLLVTALKPAVGTGPQKKLLVIVPMKSESYIPTRKPERSVIHGQYADGLTVGGAVRNTYKSLLEDLGQIEYSGKVAVAIAPARTLGGYECVGIVAPQVGQIPDIRYRRMNANDQYAPEFCEQSLYHILRFAIARRLESESAPGMVERWMDRIFRRSGVSYDALLADTSATLNERTLRNANFEIVRGDHLLVPERRPA